MFDLFKKFIIRIRKLSSWTHAIVPNGNEVARKVASLLCYNCSLTDVHRNVKEQLQKIIRRKWRVKWNEENCNNLECGLDKNELGFTRNVLYREYVDIIKGGTRNIFK